ncbi:hypothetical protein METBISCDRAFT_7301, partial [Metschnikowia bicuspidata]
MRESNYRSIANNKAAVTISTSLYDRRALDVTSDKPLVNSLNHLTYLVSSSAKVRETLANDGGIERLVAILHECQSCKFSSLDVLHESEQKLLTAWKWTLAFQCIVLIGTRGTEKIRQKVVCAGMLAVIATIFDNYRCFRDHAFAASQAMPIPLCRYALSQYFSQSSNDATPSRNHVHPQGTDFIPNVVGPQSDPVDLISPLSAENQTQSAPFMDIRLPENLPLLTNPQTAAAGVRNETQPTPQSLHQPLLTSHTSPFPLSRPDTLASLDSSPDSIFHIEKLSCEDYENLTIPNLLKLVKADFECSSPRPSSRESGFANGVDHSIRKRYLTLMLLNKLRDAKDKELDMSYLMGNDQIEMDTNLNFLTDLYLQDERSIQTSKTINTKIAPRNFTDSGIIIPRDDDVVWCLQLLAYVSKYPYLKDILQNTHLVPNMSIREKLLRLFSSKQTTPQSSQNTSQRPITTRKTLIPRSRKGCLFSPSALPESHHGASSELIAFVDRCDPFLNHFCNDLNIRNEILDLAGNAIEHYEKINGTAFSNEIQSEDDLEDFDEDSDHKPKEDEEEVDEYLSQFEDNVTASAQNSAYLSSMYDSIVDAELIVNDLDRKLALNHLNMRISYLARAELHKLSNSIIEKRLEQKNNYSQVWNYNTYEHFDIDEDTCEGCTDVDESLLQHKPVNLFPMVEQFTFFGGTDMYYWSGVIMRNLCRRNDFKGGVRQCGNLECGKWERYPREFSKCKRCKRTKYCSRECQTRAWTCHKNWCVPSNSSNSTT